MKAIETKYKGYRFRSRLEARWAVFFDALGIAWDYEPEGYDLGDSGWYLPDFYLPEYQSWAEVKAQPLNTSEMQKAFALSSLTDKPVIELCSVPAPDSYDICGIRQMIGAGMQRYRSFFFVNDLIEFYLDSACGNVEDMIGSDTLLADALAWDVDYYKKRHGKPHPTHFEQGMIIGCYMFDAGDEVALALSKARSARFEHGETP